MSFSTEVEKIASNRFMLIRIEPGFYANDDLFSSSGKYFLDAVPYVISKVERNGVALTEDSVAPTVNDHYWYDEDGGQLQIKIAAAPSSTNTIIVYYYIFLTGEKTRRVTQDPEDSTTTIRPWEPRILKYPNFKESIKNILGGALSISSVPIKLENADYYFNEFLKPNYSFYQKNIDIWVCINNSDNRLKAFNGKISNASINNNLLSLTLLDPLSNLKNKALFDPADEAYFLKTANSFPDINSNDDGTPIPMILGRYATYKTRPKTYALAAGTEYGYEIIPDESFQAIGTQFTNNPTLSDDNAIWGLCRTLGPSYSVGTHPDYTLGTITAGLIDGDVLKLTTSGHNVRTGMGVVIFQFSPSFQDYLRVFKVTSTEIYCGIDVPWTYTGYTTFTTGGVDGTALYANSACIIVKPDGTETYLVEGDQTNGYFHFSTATTNNNYYQYIDLRFTVTLSRLDPGKDKVYYTVFPSYDQVKHENIVSELLDSAGVNKNSASITQAGIDLDAPLNMTIPYRTESDFGTHLKYLEDIMSSVFGHLSLNNSFEIVYKLFATPASTTATTLDHILVNTLKLSVNYQDIVDEIIFYNLDQVQDPNSFDNEDNYEKVTSEKSKYLHDVSKTRKRKHVLEGATARVTSIAQFIRNRYINYTFQTASKDLEKNIGDDLTITGDFVIGDSGTENLKILALSKDGSATTIDASDLGDF